MQIGCDNSRFRIVALEKVLHQKNCDDGRFRGVKKNHITKILMTVDSEE